MSGRCIRSCRVIMAASTEVLQHLEQRQAIADQMILKLKDQLQGLQHSAASGPERSLRAENARLIADVESLKSKLAILESRNGLIQIPTPTTSSVPPSNGLKLDPAASTAKQDMGETEVANQAEQLDKGRKKEKKPKGEKKEKGEGGGKKSAPAVVVDVSLLDMRVGKINAVKLHPDADTLYVEEVDCGEANPRTVVSGLVQHIPIDQMQDRMVVLCCNLKPAKMRGILSQAMVMCASSPDKVELLIPPPEALPGDRISFDRYQMSEDFPPQMNPKKKLFEQIQPDLTTNSERVATYKGVPFKVEGKGIVMAPSMANSEIK